ncbi:MAG: Trk system potassium transporter TrkA [Clostridia bacterium]|nr:Trk system potassium transporter TrkA [Clostridia bacterium]
MRILIAGSGKVGETLAKQLSAEGHDVTLIDSDSRVLASGVERYDVLAVQGNCASMDTLKNADVMAADLLIATTGTDELNLLCCMTAHRMNKKLHAIARIRNPEYMAQVISMPDAFGLSLCFNPERQTAVEISRLLNYPGFLKRDSFARGHVEIVELKIDEDSKLAGVPLSMMYSIVKCRVLVCTVLRDGRAIIPAGNFVLEAGDRIFVTAPTEALAQLLKSLGILVHKTKEVVLIGGGMVSYYLADLLLKRHLNVKIIESNRERCEKLAELLPEASIIHGDATNHTLLAEEGLSECDAVATLTGMDEMNIIASLYADKRGVRQIVTKLAKIEETEIVDSLPLGSVVCPRKLCCDTVLRYVRAMQNQAGAAISIHAIADGRAEALEFRVDATTEHTGEPLKSIKFRPNLLLVSITRKGKTEIPNGDSTFEVGDTIVVVVAGGEEVILQLNDIFA